MAIGKRLRFEILKRDGFRCRYCGANASTTLLHVDHVVARADGGSDDPENLVAACADCNLGKSDVGLGESQLSNPQPTEAMLEHAEQMRAYLAAVQEVNEARQLLIDSVIVEWCERIDSRGMPKQLVNSLGYWIGQVGLETVIAAVHSVQSSLWKLRRAGSTERYFMAVLRNERDDRAAAQ